MSEMVTSKESEQCYVAIRITFLSHKASAHQISILSVKLIEVIDTKLNWIVLPARPVEPICWRVVLNTAALFGHKLPEGTAQTSKYVITWQTRKFYFAEKSESQDSTWLEYWPSSSTLRLSLIKNKIQFSCEEQPVIFASYRNAIPNPWPWPRHHPITWEHHPEVAHPRYMHCKSCYHTSQGLKHVRSFDISIYLSNVTHA
jgi:hypothetical protein